MNKIKTLNSLKGSKDFSKHQGTWEAFQVMQRAWAAGVSLLLSCAGWYGIILVESQVLIEYVATLTVGPVEQT